MVDMAVTRHGRPPNKRARQKQSSRQQAAFHYSSGKGRSMDLVADFVHAKGVVKRTTIVERLAESHMIRDLYALGAICLEMARDDRDHAAEWLTRANDTLRRAIASCSFNGVEHQVTLQRAQRLIDAMPHYYSVLLENKLPKLEWNRVMYKSIARTALATLENFSDSTAQIDSTQGNESARQQRTYELKGELSEQAVHLLSLRAAGQIGCEDWAPAPSYFSEDNHAMESKGYYQRSWDLTILTSNQQDEIDDTYLLQVKSGHSSTKHYAPGISVISVADDLQLPYEHQHLHPVRIIREVLATQELPDNHDINRRLNGRQDQLLTAMDLV